MKQRILAITMALLMSGGVMLSCGESDTAPVNDDIRDETETAMTDAAETENGTLRSDTKDSLPDDLDFNGVTLTLPYEDRGLNATQDLFGESSGDIVSDAVYKRTLAVEERLNVHFNWIKDDVDEKVMSKNLEKVISAGLPDYDMVIFQLRSIFPIMIKGYFRDLTGMPYIDYGQPWWYISLMDECAIDSSQRYFVMGDMALTPIKGASAMYFNKPMFKNYFGDDTPLYQTVLDGKWVHDRMAEYCRVVYSDLNGNSEIDADDQFGFVWPVWGVPNYLSMSTGLTYSKRGDDGLPILDLNNENSILWTEKLMMLLHDDNMSFTVDYGTTPIWFKNDQTLFHVGSLYDIDDFRELSFDFGIIPHPKLTEELNYMSGARVTNGNVGVIPISSSDDMVNACCAALEALSAESYRSVIQVYYESALKIKYVSTNIDAQMIDIIHDCISVPLIYASDKLLGIGSTFTNVIDAGKGDFASYWAKNESAINKKWDGMIEDYLSLGK